MIGERIRHARDFCGLTQVELSERCGIVQSRISDLELGRDLSVSEDDIVGIAAVTGFPVEFFYMGPLPEVPDGRFRKRKRGTARATHQVRAQTRQIVELVQRAESKLVMPPVRLNPIGNMPDVEELTRSVRSEAGVGSRDPIPNLTRALERAGIIVASLWGDMPDHSGYSVWPNFGVDGRPVIVFANEDPGDRQRFTLAHELGHLLLHSLRRATVMTNDDAEKEANWFAGALLLPEEAAREAMRPPLTLTTLAHVKASFGASIGTCAQRALDLNLIDKERFVSFRKQMSSRGWNKKEPVEVPQEKPLMIHRVMDVVAIGGSVAEKALSAGMPLFAYRSLAS
jgi:Zn-dependent peptidase ImmA (M78 family)/transcriptional regulator with XRE-family HTH domain